MTSELDTPHYDSLCENTLDDLEEALAELDNDNVMSVAEVDGFFTALHCAPEPIRPSEYFPTIWGEDTAFKSQEQVQELTELLIYLNNNVSDRLREDSFFFPLSNYQDETAEQWCQGFLAGARFFHNEFIALTEDEEKGGYAIPIFSFAYMNSDDPELRPFEGPIDREKCQKVFSYLCHSIKEIYAHFAPHRQAFMAQASTPPVSITEKREGAKVGRNDPCVCGSKRKYKKCCGP
jgi:uncharacterized protein